MRYKMGDLVELVTETNSDLKYGLKDIVGVTLEKQMIPTIANLTQTDLDDFIIVHPKDFVYNPRTHGKKIGLGFNTTDHCFISTWNNNTFRVKPEMANIIIPEYLYLHFLRERWDKEACFNAWGSSTVVLLWSSFCDMNIDVPPMSEQRKIVHDYQVIMDRIELLQKTMDKFTALVDAIYIKWIVLGESPYRSREVKQTEMGYLPLGWKIEEMGDYIESFSKSHSFAKNKLVFLNTSDILSGRFLKTAYMNVSDMPGQAKKSIAKGDILFSEIRPANKRYALVRCLADDYVVSTKLMVLRTTQNELSNLRIYHYLTMDKTLAELQKEAEGESGTFPQITFDGNLRHRKFIVADSQTETMFNKVLERHYAYIFNIQDEIDVLNSIKNMLLFEQNKGA